jgi:hypothetical protein
MSRISTLMTEPEKLQDLALIRTVKKMLQEASKLSFRLGIDIYLYNSLGFREIKKYDYVNVINEKIKFLITGDNRIATDGIEFLSTILFRNQALQLFNYFSQRGLTVHEDRTGIFYYEEDTLPYYFVKNRMTTSDDPIKWSTRVLTKGRYFNLWDD